MKRLDIKVGFSCNNNCRFCVIEDRRHYGDRTTEEIKSDMDLARKSCDSIVLTGGEITIRPDILDLISYAKNLDFQSIQLQTNGRMLYSKKFCKDAIDAGATEFSPALHGHTAELHDFLTRAPGSFNQTVQGIKNVKSFGKEVISNTVITKSNYRHLPQIAQLLIKLKVNQFQFAFVHALGNAGKNFDSIVPRKTLVSPYLNRALDIGIAAGIRCMAEAMPYCVMLGYEQCVSEKYIPKTEVWAKWGVEKDFNKRKIEDGKVKFEKCNSCRYDSVCEGPWKEYPEKLGDKEFVPVRPQSELLEELDSIDSTLLSNVLAVLTSIKPVARLETTEDKLQKITPLISQLGLLQSILTSEELSEKPEQAGVFVPPGLTKNKYLVISQYRCLIDEFITNNKVQDHKRIGQLLNYPSCCIESFLKNHKKGRSNQDLLIEICNKTEKGKPLFYNNYTEGSPYALIQHFPCNWGCEASSNLGKKLYDEIKENHPLFLERFKASLQRSVFISTKFNIYFNRDIEESKKYDSDIVDFYNGDPPSYSELSVEKDKILFYCSDGQPIIKEGHLIHFK